MSNPVSNSTILVPVDASDPGIPPHALVDLLSPHHLVVLGYYSIPEQTAPGQARDQFGEEATEAVAAIADRFAERGAGAEDVVAFTHNRSTTIDNAAAEHGADAVLTPGRVGDRLDRVLVPLRGDDNLDRILAFVGVLLRESDATATLFNVADSDDEASRGELLVRGARDRLTDDEGVDPERVDCQQVHGGSVPDAIVEAAAEYDLLVVGESEPSLTERILGDVTDEVVDRSSDPVLVVRNR